MFVTNYAILRWNLTLNILHRSLNKKDIELIYNLSRPRVRFAFALEQIVLELIISGIIKFTYLFLRCWMPFFSLFLFLKAKILI